MFGERLQARRKMLNLTLEQLATKAGTTKSYIWELENKPDIKPSADLVNRLAKELDCTVEHLVHGDGNDEDQVFFREYKSLGSDTKNTLQKILKSLKDKPND